MASATLGRVNKVRGVEAFRGHSHLAASRSVQDGHQIFDLVALPIGGKSAEEAVVEKCSRTTTVVLLESQLSVTPIVYAAILRSLRLYIAHEKQVSEPNIDADD